MLGYDGEQWKKVKGTDFVISGLIKCELDVIAAIKSVPR